MSRQLNEEDPTKVIDLNATTVCGIVPYNVSALNKPSNNGGVILTAFKNYFGQGFQIAKPNNNKFLAARVGYSQNNVMTWTKWVKLAITNTDEDLVKAVTISDSVDANINTDTKWEVSYSRPSEDYAFVAGYISQHGYSSAVIMYPEYIDSVLAMGYARRVNGSTATLSVPFKFTTIWARRQ